MVLFAFALDVARGELRQRRRKLRQLVEVGFQVDRCALLEQFGIDGHDRAGCGVVLAGDARTGDDDRLGGRRGFTGSRRVLCQRGRRKAAADTIALVASHAASERL